MAMKTRVMRVLLYSGGYLARDGRPTYRTAGTAQAVQLRAEDAYQLLTTLRPLDRNDKLWGASLEMLPKRGTYMPLSEADFREFLLTLKTVRLLWQAEQYEQLAESYASQAKYAEKLALQMREKASALRQTLTT